MASSLPLLSSSPATMTVTAAPPHSSILSFPIALRRGSISRSFALSLRTFASRNVAVKSDSETAVSGDPSPSASPEEEEDDELKRSLAKVGARVRVTAPLKVYHVPKVPEVELTGLEGEIKQYVGYWKGKRISANFPYKIEFQIEVDGRGSVKFFSHLREDEFEYI